MTKPSEAKDIYHNAHTYIQTTAFQKMGAIKQIETIRQLQIGDTPNIRIDRRDPRSAFDRYSRLSEVVVKAGEQVSVEGVWDATRQGIVAKGDSDALVVSGIHLTRGDLEKDRCSTYMSFIAFGLGSATVFVGTNLLAFLFIQQIIHLP